MFIAPMPISLEVTSEHEVVAIGDTDEVRHHFYAISVERRISHSAVAAITQAAREWLAQDNKQNKSSGLMILIVASIH